jgi:quercetin dioxygenase-like cupin family protein
VGTDHDQGGDPACLMHVFEGDSAPAVFADLASIEGVGGAVWSLPHGGDLDANLVRLAPNARIDEHVNDEVDVLIVVREGVGELTVDGIRHPLKTSAVALVRRRARRSIRAGANGLAYMTVHRSRSPLTIKTASPRTPV